jgi:ubiquinone/menaquinone biosynthesis C-methylase UbiE
MKLETLNILCNPNNLNPLELLTTNNINAKNNNVLIDRKTNTSFQFKNNIPIFINESELIGLNMKYQKLYNRAAFFYDIIWKIYSIIKSGSEKDRRLEYLNELEISERDRILEVSIGTGINIKYLRKDIKYYGLDISWGMLNKCQNKCLKHNWDVELFYGNAEKLPFIDNSFDVVFHVGGINYFNNKKMAILEMIRVAKSGTKIVIVDETEELAKKYEDTLFAEQWYKDRTERISAPVDLLPSNMLDVEVKIVGGGDLFCLSFRKQ